MHWLGYSRAWTVLKVGLAAGPLAPLIASLVGADLGYPAATSARAATILTAALVATFLTRAVRRSPREALSLLASTVFASTAAAHIIAVRENSFFIADLLFEICAGLLAMSAVSAGLRLVRAGAPTATAVPTFSAHREVSDTITRLSAWLIVGFWACVAIGLHYVAGGVLFLLAGTIAVTLLLRMAELAMNPRPGATDS